MSRVVPAMTLTDYQYDVLLRTIRSELDACLNFAKEMAHRIDAEPANYQELDHTLTEALHLARLLFLVQTPEEAPR